MRSAPPRRRSLSRRGWLRLLAILGALAGAAWAWHSGALDTLTIDGLRAQVAAAGPLGPVLFVLAFSALQPVGVSAHLFCVVAGLCWAPLPALALAWLGMVGAAAVAFGIGRWMGREAIQARMPGWLEKWDTRLAEGGLRAVIVVRLLFWTTWVVQLMMAVSRVSFRDYLLGSAIGATPVLLFDVLMADRVATWIAA